MSEFCMPSLGSDMEDGTLIEWQKQPGDTVHRGDIIAVVETQKGAIEIEVYEDGVLEKVLAKLGDKLPVGTPLAVIGDGSNFRSSNVSVSPVSISDAAVSENSAQRPLPDNVTRPAIDNESPLASAPHQIERDEKVSSTGERVRATPAAKKLATDSNINLASLAGSGPESAIVLDDVKAAIRAKEFSETDATTVAVAQPATFHDNANNGANPKPPSAVTSMDGMRAAIAAAMTRSKREIPHYYLSHCVQLDKLMAYISENNAQRQPDDRLIPGALYIKAVALAVSKFPEFNGHYNDGQFTASKAIHMGMAINIRGGGLVAPAIHNANTLGIDDTMAKLKDLVTRVRKGRFKAAEISDPTLTISSLGDRGVERLYGVIFPPQVAIVGIGTPVSSVKMGEDGSIVPIHTITITLAADHRVSDGHRGALFLRTIGRLLNEPEKLQ